MSQILHILVAHEHVGRIANVLWKIELIFPKHLLNGLGIEIPRCTDHHKYGTLRAIFGKQYATLRVMRLTINLMREKYPPGKVSTVSVISCDLLPLVRPKGKL